MGFIRKTLTGIVLAASLFGCGSKVEKEFYSGSVDNQKVVVLQVKKDLWKYSINDLGTKVVVYDKSGNISRVMYDAGSGKLGDENEDYVEIHHSDGTARFDRNCFTGKKGARHHFYSSGGLKSEFEKRTAEEFEKANVDYQKAVAAAVAEKTR